MTPPLSPGELRASWRCLALGACLLAAVFAWGVQ